jgi:membrane-bound serine protease (ClpP class)
MSIKTKLIKILIILLLFFYSFSDSHQLSVAENNNPVFISIDISETITAGTTCHIKRTLVTAKEINAGGVILIINTPGGLVSATLDIVQEILSSDVPVITYVAPQGAIAASAGSFILISGNIAVMSPGTTTGAAMPVMISPAEESPQTADNKTITFLAGHMRSIASERNRPPHIAEQFVTENLTLDAKEALESEIIDLISLNLDSLLKDIHGYEVTIKNEKIILNTENAVIEEFEMSLRERITDIVSNPEITYILLLLGIYGLIIGFNSPGTFVPEVLGAISLILGLYGLGLFAVNIFAGLMILLGIILLVTEALTPTYGVLATGGIISLVLGTIFLPVEPLMPSYWFVRFRIMAIGIGVASSIFLIIILSGIIRLKKSRVIHGDNEFNDQAAIVIETLSPKGLVRIQGETWAAVSDTGETIPEGETVKIVSRKDMTVNVEILKKH